MTLAICSTMRSFRQILAIFNVDLAEDALTEISDCGKVILSGGFQIFRNTIVQKKIGKFSAGETQTIFNVNI